MSSSAWSHAASYQEAKGGSNQWILSDEKSMDRNVSAVLIFIPYFCGAVLSEGGGKI
jgi:hypothetical protein